MDARIERRGWTGLAAGLALLLMGCPGDDTDTSTGAETVGHDSTSASGTSAGSGSTAPTGSASNGSASGSGGGSGGSGPGGSSDSGPGGSSDSAGDSGDSTGGVCMEAMGSCANGEQCCSGLICCEGVPVPEGEEYCDAECPMSDHNLKQQFESVDPEQILDRVAALPITTWSYRHDDPSVRHLGPMAQDFKASFELGATDRSIFVVDADGVALSSIQALYRRLKAAEARNAELEQLLGALQQRVEALETSAKSPE